MTKIVHVLKLVRYPNLLIVAATQFLCFYGLSHVLYAAKFPPAQFYYILAASVFTAAAGYIINDILDIKADRINKPGKIYIKEGAENQYRIAYYFINIVALVFSALAGLGVFFSTLFLVVLLYFYSKKLKHLPLAGNLAVSLCSAAVLWVFFFSSMPFENELLWGYGWFAFVTTLIREIVKDMEDMEGDKAAGSHTLPLAYGTHAARIAALACTVLVISGLLGLCVYFLSPLHLRLIAFYYLVLLCVIPCIGLFLQLLWAGQKKHYSQASLYIKLIMISGLLSILFV